MSKEEFKKILIEILKEDEHFKSIFIEILSNIFVLRPELQQFLNEIKNLNQNLIQQMQLFGNEMKQLREDFSSEMKQLREETSLRFNSFENEMKQLREDNEMKQLREDFSSEMKQLREETNRQFNSFKNEMKQLREETNRQFNSFKNEMKQLREETNRQFNSFKNEMKQLREETNRQFNSFKNEMKQLREDFNLSIKRFNDKISSIGARWGFYNEESIKKGIIDILKGKNGFIIKKWKVFDKKGIVYARPSMVECDILIINDNVHELIEIKSSVKKSDITELLRIAELYESNEGIKPKLRIITAYIDPRSKSFADETWVEISSPDEYY